MKFYRETEFQETEIGKIPKDWETAKINELFELYKGTTPSTKIKSYWDGDIPFVTPTDITSTKSIYLTVTEKYLSKEGLQSKKLKLVPENSLLFTSRATIGYLAINLQKVAINQGIIALIPRKSNVSSLFYYYYLLYKRKMFEELAGGSTYKEISMNIFSKVTVSLPPFEEQKRITDILSTFDKTLEDVDETINRLERLKKALMGELLAGRIRVKEVDGKLTFYRETEFQETEIGKIPKDWDVVKLETIGDIVDGFAFPIKYQGKKNGRYIFAKVSDTNLPGNEKYISVTENTIDDELVEKIGVKIYPSGTIIFPKIGMVIYLRKVRILTKAGTFDNNIMGIIPNEKIINREFLYYLLLGKIDLTKLVEKTTTPSIRKSEVKKLKIPRPSQSEQQKIVEIISTFDRAIEFYQYERSKLEKVKKGLMNILLTGKVRVRSD